MTMMMLLVMMVMMVMMLPLFLFYMKIVLVVPLHVGISVAPVIANVLMLVMTRNDRCEEEDGT